MPHSSHVHVIDPDINRRAQIARELMSRKLHAEIYEDLEEFRSAIPSEGAVLIADHGAHCGPAALRAVLETENKPLAFAAFSGEVLPERIVLAMLAGAADYLRWPFEGRLLEAALMRLAATAEYRAREHRHQFDARAAIQELSDRERDVLQLLMLGDSNKDVGRKLQISSRTVEIYRGNMLRKLNARTSSAAVRIAMLAGLDEWTGDGQIAA